MSYYVILCFERYSKLYHFQILLGVRVRVRVVSNAITSKLLTNVKDICFHVLNAGTTIERVHECGISSLTRVMAEDCSKGF